MMNLKTWSLLPLTLTLGLLVRPARGEQAVKAPDPSAQHSASASTAQPQKKLTLSDVTRVNTSEAARHAAEGVARTHASPGKAAAEDKAADAPGVVEFQPAGAEAREAGKSVVTAPDKSKSALKNVHGSVYGALGANDAGNRESAASIGATSKSGKTAVYVETDHTRATSPAPH